MALDQVVCSVQIQPVNVPAMLVTKAPNVMQLVVAILLVQAVHHVMLLLANVLARLVTQVSRAIPAQQITIEQVMELAKVRLIVRSQLSYLLEIFLFSACSCDSTGSSSLQCADSTGLCTCNAGYKGTNCNAACGCDTTGSSSTACDQSTGQCTCKTGYTGVTCNSCATNYYRASDGTCTGQILSSHCSASFFHTYMLNI